MAKSKKPRSPLDFYPTPQPLCDAVCAWLDKHVISVNTGRVLEPSSGTGNFIRAARRVWPNSFIQAVDVNPAARAPSIAAGANSCIEGDFTKLALEPPNLIVGNPPYCAAEAHVRHAIRLLAPTGVVAFVLRIGFLGSADRLAFWRELPARYMVPIVPRPSFTGDGKTDGSEYALYVWERDPAGPSILKPQLVWEKPSRRLPHV